MSGLRLGIAFRSHATLGPAVLRAVALVSACLSSAAYGQTAGDAEANGVFREEVVPASDPESWPRGEWRAIPRDEYEWFRRRVLSPEGPPPARIEDATYEAVVSGPNLSAGLLKFRVRYATRFGGGPISIGLNPLNLAVSELTRNDAPALWGTDEAGRAQLLIRRPSADRAREEIVTGQFTAAGRVLSSGCEFSIDVAPATVTHLRLHVPEGLLVRSSFGEVVGPTESTRSGHRLWRIELGSVRRTRVTVLPEETAVAAGGAVLAEMSTDAVLSRDGLRYRTAVRFEVLDSSREQFVFLLPSGGEIESVTYGADLPLSWRESNTKGGRRLAVRLPEPVSGRGRPLTITDRLPARQQTAFLLPRLLRANSTGARVTLEVRKPLVVHDLELAGLRQTGTVLEQPGAEVFAFEQFAPRASIDIAAGRPELRATQRVVSHLSLEGSEWLLDTELLLAADSGSAAELTLRHPEEWLVTDVRTSSGSAVGPDWSSGSDENGPFVRLDLRKPLAAGSPLHLRIQARRFAADPYDDIDIPSVRADLATPEAVLVAVTPPEGWQARLRPGGDFGADLSSPALDELAAESVLWASPGLSLAPQSLRIGSEDGSPVGRVSVTDAATDLAGDETLAAANVDERPALPPSPSGPTADSLLLTTSVPGRDGGPVRHAATFAFPRGLGRRLSFELPANVELLGVTSEGRILSVARTADGLVALTSPTANPTEVTILYRQPLADGIAPLLDVPVPQLSTPCADFAWELRLAPEWEIDGAPDGLAAASRASTRGWQFFGPLSRRGEFFRPGDRSAWLWLWDRFRGADRGAVVEAHEATLQFVAPIPPSQLSLRVWHARSVAALAWAGLFGTIFVGLLLRVRRWQTRRRIASIWAGLCLAAPWLLPTPLASLAGACLLGTLVATLVPRAWLPRQADDPMPSSIPTGSTERVELPTVLRSLLPVVGLGTLAWIVSYTPLTAFAQDEVEAGDGESVTPAGVPRALIPTDAEGREAPVVYVSPAVERAVNEVNPSPAYVLSSAEYDAELESERFLSLQASFDVSILTGGRVSVHLPISGAHLAGAEACRVDGQTVPVRRHPTRAGYLVELTRPSDGTEREGGPLRAPRPFPEPYHRRVVLDLFPEVTGVSGGGSAAVSVPPVMNCVLRFDTGSRPLWLTARTRGGQRRLGSRAGTFRASLEWTDRIGLTWSETPEPVGLDSRVQVSVRSLAAVTPTSIDYYIEATHTIETGRTSFLTWPLPPAALVRSVAADGLRSWARRGTSEGQSTLLLEFDEERSGEVVVLARLTVPTTPTGGEPGASVIRVPNLFPPQGSAMMLPSLRVSDRSLAVAAPAAFGVSVVADDEFYQPTPVNRVLSGWPVGLRLPNLTPHGAWQFRGALEGPDTPILVTLSPRETNLEARVNQVGQVEAGRIGWSYSATVRVSGASTYTYRLRVDPRLRIDSVSVKQAGAERALRFDRTGGELLVFLRGPATGTQTLLVNAALPIEFGQRVPLPEVSLKNADVSASDLVLYQEPDLQVDLLDGDSLAMQMEEATSTSDRTRVKLGRFLWEIGSVAPAVMVTRRDVAVGVDVLTVFEQPTASAVPTRVFLVFREPPSEDGWKARLAVPAGVEVDVSARGADAQLQDGGRLLVVSPTKDTVKDETGAAVVTLSVMLPLEDSRRLGAFGVEPVAGAGTRFFWAFSSEHVTPIKPVDGIDPDELPESVAGLVPTESRVVTGLGDPVRFRVTDDTGTEPDVLVAVWETRLTQHSDRLTGLTRLVVRGDGTAPLAVQIPPSVTVRVAKLDGRPFVVEAEAEAVVIDAAWLTSPREVELLWEAPVLPLPFFSGTVDMPLPAPIGVVPEERLIACVLPDGADAIMPVNATVISPAEYRSRRGSTRSGDASPDTVSIVVDSEPSDVVVATVDAELLPRSSGATPAVIRLEVTRYFWPRVVGVALGFLAVVPLLMLLLRPATGAWLARHPRFALLLLGLTWWVCLENSAAGFFLIVAALVASAVTRLRRKPEPESPSEVLVRV